MAQYGLADKHAFETQSSLEGGVNKVVEGSKFQIFDSVTGDGIELAIGCLGKVKLMFPNTVDIFVTMTGVTLIRDLVFNLC